MDFSLPPELSEGAILRDKEYAWELSAFPKALQVAPHLGYACLGGQFWFLLKDDSLYEPFWIEANAGDRTAEEPWSVFTERSCEEVLSQFQALVEKTDFAEEARKFGSFEGSRSQTIGPVRLLFNAYFITERQFCSLHLETLRSMPNR